tara:strand:- start:324 stop:716 length:393 start_codon:yes stop_codon:yes gene_type:complete
MSKELKSKNAETKPELYTVLGNVSFSKELFIETISEIEKQVRHDSKCSDAFEVLLPSDYISSYDNSFLQNQLIKIIQVAMNDKHKDSWIEYFMWEMDFGRKYKEGSVTFYGKNFELKTASDLWDLLLHVV